MDVDYEKIYTIKELRNILRESHKDNNIGFGNYNFRLSSINKFTQKILNDLNCQNPKFLKIFICNEYSENDA